VPVPHEKAEASGPAPSNWGQLIADGSVWARPELDRFCAKGSRAYYVRVTPSESYDQPQVPEASGCRPRFAGTPVEVGVAAAPCGATGVPGQTYCCPGKLEPPPGPTTGGGPSCETALVDYVVELGVDPLVASREEVEAKYSDGELAAVLNDGSYLRGCGVSDRERLQICAAVRDGRALGVTVCMGSDRREAAECVAEAVRGRKFRKQDRLDLIQTTFEPVK
jgi:hypothetical protein